MLPDNITLNSINKRIDQSLSDFEIGIGATAHATLDTEQFISHTRTALVDTIASLQGSGCGVIVASKVGELLIKIHDILENALSKWVGNMFHIMA